MPAGVFKRFTRHDAALINAAQTYIYVECQSLNPVSFFEQEYQEHTKLFPLFADALKRGVKVIFVSGIAPLRAFPSRLRSTCRPK